MQHLRYFVEACQKLFMHVQQTLHTGLTNPLHTSIKLISNFETMISNFEMIIPNYEIMISNFEMTF